MNTDLDCIVGQEVSVQTTFEVLQVLKNRKDITKKECNSLKEVSKTFFIAFGYFPCKPDLKSYRFTRIINTPYEKLDFIDKAWGRRIKEARISYNVGDNQFLKEVEKLTTLWKEQYFPIMNSLIIEFAYTPCIRRVDNVFPTDTEVFSIFENVVFSHGCGKCHIKDCHKLALELFPHLKKLESVVLAVHRGNYPYWIVDNDRCMEIYEEQAAPFVESCTKQNASVEIQKDSKLCDPWRDDYLF